MPDLEEQSGGEVNAPSYLYARPLCRYDNYCCRDFIEKYYVGLKQENPSFPFLIRECSGVEPKLYGRYCRLCCYCATLGMYTCTTAHGVEDSVSLAGKSGEEVLSSLEKMVTAKR